MFGSKAGEILAIVFLKMLAALVRLLPLETALSVGRFFGAAAFYFLPRRRVAYANLKAAFGSRYSARERKRIVKRLARHLAENGIEMLRFAKMDSAYFGRYITPIHRDRYDAASHEKRGTVLMTPHFGNWELTQVLSSLVGRPLHVLARRQKHGKLDDYLNRLRASQGAVPVLKGESVRPLFRILKSGGMVGVLGDLSGGRLGTVVEFFGRKTTAPDGIFAIARRTQSLILPVFMVRERGGKHRIVVEEPFRVAQESDEARDVQAAIRRYYGLLEKWIAEYPDQWLWLYKRWKYCFTKKILVLDDGRSAHTEQSLAVARELERLKASLPPDYEFQFCTARVRFKSRLHRAAFFVFAFFFLPFAQGRLNLLELFLEPESAANLTDRHADIVISAGASLAPLNLILKRENLSRSIAVMKPPPPFGPARFDLTLAPVHDHFRTPKKGRVLRMVLAPGRLDEGLFENAGHRLCERMNLSANGRSRLGVFIGGNTRAYRIRPEALVQWLSELKRWSLQEHCELLVTTSRRTDAETAALVKAELSSHFLCRLLIVANESNVEGAVCGMLALSDRIVVTEDSISMISDAVRAGKPVVVVRLGNGKLPAKHKRFCDILYSRSLINISDSSNFASALDSTNGLRTSEIGGEESKRIQEALRPLV